MTQVQVRIPQDTVNMLDSLVKKGEFQSRSDAIKTILAIYKEKEKTREFYNMLVKRSQETDKLEELV